jgi:hypothetical protein
MLRLQRWLVMTARRTRVVALITFAAGVPAAAQVESGNGFLIGTPNTSLTIRGGWALAAAHSDVFSFTTNQLTLDRGDFSSPALDVDVGFRIAKRTDVLFSTTFAETRKKSEFRRLIDNDNQAIEQQTQFVRLPLTVSLKQYLSSRGRSIGKLAWIPSRVAPYVGAGAGIMWYDFRQQGDFVDFQTMDVFNAVLESKGWAPTAHGFAGIELSVSPRLGLVTETRYVTSHAKLGSDFSNFAKIDLSGFSTTAGLTVRF